MLDTRALYKSKKKLRNTREQCRTIKLLLLHIQNVCKVQRSHSKKQKESDLDNFYITVSNYGWAKKNVNRSRSVKGFPNGLNYQKV